MDFLTLDSNTSSSRIDKINLATYNIMSWNASNFTLCDRFFSEGNNYYGINPNGTGGDGLIYGKENEPGVRKYSSLGLINEVNMYKDRFIIGTAHNSLWYIDNYGNPKRYLEFWRNADEGGYKMSDSDYVGNMPNNSIEAPSLIMKIVPFGHGSTTLSTLYETIQVNNPGNKSNMVIIIISCTLPFLFAIIFILFWYLLYRNNKTKFSHKYL